MTRVRTSEARGGRVSRAAFFASAAGVAGIIANALLIAFYAFQVGRPISGFSLGSANDLIGSLSTALMLPVIFAISASLPESRLGYPVHLSGLAAMIVLTVGGPLLVLEVLRFEVQAPIMAAAWMVLCIWLFSVNRSARVSGLFSRRLARFGELTAAGPIVGGVIVALGFLFPWMSWGQWLLFGIGGAFGLIGFFGIPVWFLLLGRHLATS